MLEARCQNKKTPVRIPGHTLSNHEKSTTAAATASTLWAHGWLNLIFKFLELIVSQNFLQFFITIRSQFHKRITIEVAASLSRFSHFSCVLVVIQEY